MAMNLRLQPELEAALREKSARTGMSQQQLIREALERDLGLTPGKAVRSSLDELIAAGIVHPPREPFRRAPQLASLPEGVTTFDLLDREDRF